MNKPKILVLRGNSVNPWDLRPMQLLEGEFEFRVLVPTANQFESDALGIPGQPTSTLATAAPPGPIRSLAARAPINRTLGAGEHFAWADLVHAADLSTWFSAEAARRKQAGGFRLCLTVWETLPFRHTYRNRFSARNRDLALAQTDRFFAMTARARAALELEGVRRELIEITYPGIDTGHFATARELRGPDAGTTILAPGRLVWEKGHQDLIRAIAALASGVVETDPARIPRAIIVGNGPESDRLRAYAADLGVADRVEFAGGVGYDAMVGQYARANTMFLGSIPVTMWEEQFGMVFAEAMAAGLPIIAARSGAIGEVVGEAGDFIEPGDWLGLAELLAGFDPQEATERTRAAREQRAALFSSQSAAERLGAAYRRALER